MPATTTGKRYGGPPTVPVPAVLHARRVMLNSGMEPKQTSALDLDAKDVRFLKSCQLPRTLGGMNCWAWRSGEQVARQVLLATQVAELRRELAEAREERDILRKAYSSVA